MVGEVRLSDMKLTYKGRMTEERDHFRWRSGLLSCELDFLFEKVQPLDGQALPIPFEWVVDDGSVKQKLLDMMPLSHSQGNCLKEGLRDVTILALFGRLQKRYGVAVRQAQAMPSCKHPCDFVVANGPGADEDLLIEFSCPMSMAEAMMGLVTYRGFRSERVTFYNFQISNDDVGGISAADQALVTMVFPAAKDVDALRQASRSKRMEVELAYEEELDRFMQHRQEVRRGYLDLCGRYATGDSCNLVFTKYSATLTVEDAVRKEEFVYDFRYDPELLESFEVALKSLAEGSFSLPDTHLECGEARFVQDDLTAVCWYREPLTS